MNNLSVEMDVYDVADYTKAAKEAVQAMGKWGKEVEALVHSGATVSKLEDVLKNLKIFSLASNSSVLLGVVSGGLQIIGHLMGMKTTEEEMLEAMNDISTQIACLSKQLDDMYQKTVLQMDLHTAREQISDSTKYLDMLKVQVDAYAEMVKNGESTVDIESRFPFHPRGDIQEAVMNICKAGTTMAGGIQYNILQSVYNLSYGMFEEVLEQSVILMQYALIGLYLDGFFSVYKYSKEGNSTDVNTYLSEASDTAMDLYGPSIDGLTSVIQELLTYCKTDVSGNLERMIDEEYTSVYKLDDHEDYKNLCDNLVNRVSEQWQWLDFMVTVNDEASGYDYHGIVGPKSHYWKKWHQPFGTKGRELHLTIAWADKGVRDAITDDEKNLAKSYVRKTANFNSWGTKRISGDEMKTILNDFGHDKGRPGTGVLRICWHDLHMTASCSNTDRFCVWRPTITYNKNAYNQPMKNQYYNMVFFA